MVDGMERNMSTNVGFRIPRMFRAARGKIDVSVSRYDADVDFLSQEYTLYYKVDTGIKKIVALSVFSYNGASLSAICSLFRSRVVVSCVDYVASRM